MGAQQVRLLVLVVSASYKLGCAILVAGGAEVLTALLFDQL
jgi:hypothetical protein